jgi:hypothetical protein
MRRRHRNRELRDHNRRRPIGGERRFRRQTGIVGGGTVVMPRPETAFERRKAVAGVNRVSDHSERASRGEATRAKVSADTTHSHEKPVSGA